MSYNAAKTFSGYRYKAVIIKLGVKNFFCFKDGIDINFAFDGNVPENVSLGRPVSTVMGIKGGNGSGKTNIIKAIEFLSEFCAHSANKDINDEIDIAPYYESDEPTEFYIEFKFRDSCFFYELALTKEKVISEVIYKSTKRKTRILERQLDEIVYTTKALNEIKTIQLRNNASVISLVSKYKFKSPMEDLTSIRLFFGMILTNVTHLGRNESTIPYHTISERYKDNDNAFKFVKFMIIAADNGIEDVTILRRKNDDGKEIYFPIFTHKHNNKTFKLTIHDESSGTKSLYSEMYRYWLVLSTGGLLAIDEFDIHLHALILPKIIDLFISKETNPRNAQFIFTAHNTEIIDTLGKYRTILVNKEDNESYCYRLDEIPGSIVRNDRSITPLYLEGKIGGVPRD